MALSEKQINDAADIHQVFSPYSKVRGGQFVAGYIDFARAIEAAVHKQDTALIRQMQEALNTVEWNGGGSCWVVDDRAIAEAITAASARLEGKP